MSVRTPRKKGKIWVRENTKGKGEKSGRWEYQGKKKKIGCAGTPKGWRKIGRAQTRRRKGKNMMGKGEKRVGPEHKEKRGKIGSAGTPRGMGKIRAAGTPRGSLLHSRF